MALGSNVNPNFPIPGLDQNSKGFRDNFAIIKRELEDIQGTTLQFSGAIIGGPVQLGSSSSIVVDTAINSGVIALEPPDTAVQFNHHGLLKGNNLFVFDNANVALGIGTSFATNVSIRTANAVHVGQELRIINNIPASTANALISTANLTVSLSNLDTSFQVSTDKLTDISFRNSDNNLLFLSKQGNVGIGTTDTSATLHVVGTTKDLGKLFTDPAFSDSIFRLSTRNATSTIGLGLEHRAFGYLGGMRIDSAGTVSIHSGESQDAYLSTTTARIVITRDGSVGVGNYNPVFALDVNGSFKSAGITDFSNDVVKTVGINNPSPTYALDVVGDMQLTGANIVKPGPIYTTGTSPVTFDAWAIADFQSARYTLQAVSQAPEVVHMFEFSCFHANGSASIMNIADLSSGASLGAVSVAISGGFLEVMFTGTAAGIILKAAKTYIPT